MTTPSGIELISVADARALAALAQGAPADDATLELLGPDLRPIAERVIGESGEGRVAALGTALGERDDGVELLRRIVRIDPTSPPNAKEERARSGSLLSAPALLAKEIEATQMVVSDLLGVGVALLAGKPKMGKSWLSLNLAVAVAAGGRALGQLDVDQGSATYLALEDTEARLQDRLNTILGDEPVPECLLLGTLWRRLDEVGLDDLRAALEQSPDPRLVVIDTLKRIRRPRSNGQSLYDYDYESVEPLIELAIEFNVAILLVHHMNKLPPDAADPLDLVSGSTGLTAAVDTVMLVRRERGRMDAALFVTGRDVEEADRALVWNEQIGTWSIEGDADEFRRTRERSDIVALLAANATEEWTARQISTELNKRYDATRQALSRLERAGEITRVRRGVYQDTAGAAAGRPDDGNQPQTELEL